VQACIQMRPLGTTPLLEALTLSTDAEI
jgi:hypothetical protein